MIPLKDLLTSKLPRVVPLSVALMVFSYTIFNKPLLYIVSILPLFLLFVVDRKKLSLLSTLIFIPCFLLILYLIPVNSFTNFSLVVLFTILLIILLISINSYFPMTLSIIFLSVAVYLSETAGKFNIYIGLLGFITILFSLFVKHTREKNLSLWENRFLIREKYKKGIIIIFALLIAISPLFLALPRVKSIPIPKSILTITPENKIGENPTYENPPSEGEGEVKPSIHRVSIGEMARKVISFALNYIYVITLFGLIVFLVLILVLTYKNIKNMVGRKKALLIFLTSVIGSFGFFILLYLSYIPFTKLVDFISKLARRKTFGGTGTTFGFSRYVNKFLKGVGVPEIKSTSIDIFVIVSIITISILVSIMIIILILHLYKEAFGDKAKRESIISSEFRITPSGESEENLSGNPRERIIKLYKLLIHKLRVIVGKNLYETPLEYKEKVLKEKPIISKEMELITENFVISRYSNYNIDEGMWKSTIKAFVNIKKKLFKEVINGG
ncbi:MAG TPA: hypothetical protein ENG37_00410 [Firmicutes bacterium]|nr:hypothetical protein [Bacillota bacterium]